MCNIQMHNKVEVEVEVDGEIPVYTQFYTPTFIGNTVSHKLCLVISQNVVHDHRN